MIEGNLYTQLVRSYFDFLVTEFDFKLLELNIKHNIFYEVQYKDKTKKVIISYKNLSAHLMVVVSMSQNKELSGKADDVTVLSLDQLAINVSSYIDKAEIYLNDKFFSKFYANGKLEMDLLKAAKELRLCLRHFHKLELN